VAFRYDEKTAMCDGEQGVREAKMKYSIGNK
jgi:hypothetical protein